MSALAQDKQQLTKGNVLAFLIMVLCNIILATTAEIAISSQHSAAGFVGLLGAYAAGAILLAAFLDLYARFGLFRNAWQAEVFVLAAMLLPALLAFISTLVQGQLVVGLGLVQALGWGAQLALCYYLFFSYSNTLNVVLLFTLAFGAGQLCWAILSYFVPLAVELIGRTQLLYHMNLFRLLLCAMMAWAGQQLLRLGRTPEQLAEIRNSPSLSEPGQCAKSLYILVPILLCLGLGMLVISGMQLWESKYNPHPELQYLIMAALCPVLALWLTDNEQRLLVIFGLVIICFTLSPLLLAGGAASLVLRAVVSLLGGLILQLMYLAGMLILNLLYWRGPLPMLSMFLPWCVVFLLLPGISLARLLALHAPGVLVWLAVFGALGCLFCVPRLKKLLPFPQPGAERQAVAVNSAVVDQPDPKPPLAQADIFDPARQKLFCAAFQLTRREAEILDCALHNLDVEEVIDRLQISERTVRFHLTGILRKTGQLNRRRLVNFFVYWCENGAETGQAVTDAGKGKTRD